MGLFANKQIEDEALNRLTNGKNGSNGKGQRNGGASKAKCSLCGKTYERSTSGTVPFCSIRCQQIDLGRWLNEDYGFPIERSDDGFDREEIDPESD